MTMALRLIDTALKPARWNIAMTAALMELHRTGRISDTLRFHIYPKSVLIGRHQVLAQSVNLNQCRRRNFELARRVTGGGAVYMTPGVLAWDLVASRARIGADLGRASADVCGAVAAGLSRIGLAARYRAANEIEVAGKKIAGASGYFDGPTLIYQGAILIDVDLNEMGEVLKFPSAGAARFLPARIASIRDFLGRTPANAEIAGAVAAGISDFTRLPLVHAEPSQEEMALAGELHDREIGSDSFVDGIDPLQAGATALGREHARTGIVEAHVRVLPGANRIIDQIWLTGCFSANPSRVIPDLEAALRGVPIGAAADRAIQLLADDSIDLRGASRFDIAAAIMNAASAKSDKQPRSKQGRSL